MDAIEPVVVDDDVADVGIVGATSTFTPSEVMLWMIRFLSKASSAVPCNKIPPTVVLSFPSISSHSMRVKGMSTSRASTVPAVTSMRVPVPATPV